MRTWLAVAMLVAVPGCAGAGESGDCPLQGNVRGQLGLEAKAGVDSPDLALIKVTMHRQESGQFGRYLSSTERAVDSAGCLATDVGPGTYRFVAAVFDGNCNGWTGGGVELFEVGAVPVYWNGTLRWKDTCAGIP